MNKFYIASAIQQGIDVLSSGGAQSAIEHFSAVLQYEPHNPQALRGHGVAKTLLGEFEEGIESLLAARTVAPDDPGICFDLARAYEIFGALADSVTTYRELYDSNPTFPNVVSSYVRVLLACGERRSVVSVLNQEFEHGRMTLPFLETFGAVLRDLGDVGRAKKVWEAVLVRGTARDITYAAYAKFLSESNLEEDAKRVLITALHYHKESTVLRSALAQNLEFSGDLKGAASEYRKTLEQEPGCALAIAGLLNLQLDNDQDLYGLGCRAFKTSGAPAARSRIGYALGKACDRKNDYQSAFQWWVEANRNRELEGGRFDRSAMHARIDSLITGSNPALHASLQAEGVVSELPILVVGMPRSGTTLVEQVISAHSICSAAGELQDLPVACSMALEQAGGIADDESWCAKLNAASQSTRRDAAHYYLDRLQMQGGQGAQRVVDKAPFNFLNIGAALALMPKTKVIWCLRDPRDVCLSIFSENFSVSQSYAANLDDAAWVYAMHLVLLDHWVQMLGKQLHVLSYATFVGNPDAETARLFEYIELESESACYKHYEGVVAGKTPSRLQVRRPIYSSSVGRWRNYEQHLTGLMDSLEQYDPESQLRTKFGLV